MSIPFDQYQRYRTMQMLIENIKKYYGINKLKILEIGSNSQLNLQKFVPDEDITYSDLEIPSEIDKSVNFIKADSTNLNEIKDNQYDIVISLDVLEHIPESSRGKFFQEISRVAKLANIHCFPFKSEANISSEIRTNTYYKALYGKNHIWLQEHIENGLPEISKIEKTLNSMEKKYFMFEHGDILLWESMTKSTFYSYYSEELIQLQKNLDDFYNKNVYKQDIGEENYRKFCIISSDNHLEEYLQKEVKKFFNFNPSERYLNFIHKNISDIQSVNQTELYRKRKKNNAIASLYLNNGAGYNENDKVELKYYLNDSSASINFYLKDIKDKIINLRFDPIEGKYSVLTQLNIRSNNGKLSYELVNGFYLNDMIIFDTEDPQILINIDEPIEWISIDTTIKAFNSKASSEIFNELKKIEYNDTLFNEIESKLSKSEEEITSLINNLKDKNKIIEENIKSIKYKEAELDKLNNELGYYKLHYNAAIAQRSDLSNRLAQTENNLNIIINSTCWKVTKPLRVSLDSMKKILKSNKYTHLLFRGLKCFKRNGVKYTFRKVKQKLTNIKSYDEYLNKNILTDNEKNIQVNTKFSKNIKFSIVVPLYNTPKIFLCEMIDSCINQTYGNWELCLADGSDKEHSYVEKIVKGYIKKDKRIKYKILEKNGGISENTNECISMSSGEYIALFDHDDLLHPSALFEYMKVICEKDADFIYCDEDKFDTDVNKSFDPHFKPDFAIDNLRANNYICHFTVFKKSLLDEVGLFRKEFDGSQDHDMILRLTEKAKNIVHIPKILYHWRVSPNSVASDPYAKPYTIEAGINAVSEHLKRCDLDAIIESSNIHPNIYRIKYAILNNPLISILIPNKDHVVDLSRCINSILDKSTYKNIEIIIIENNSEEKETFDYYESLQKYKNIKVIRYESDGTFNYSAINNFGFKHTKGEYLLLLNNDIEIISENWIEEMLMYSQREDVGAVGAKLYYPNDTIQHAGLGIGILTLAGHYFRNFPRNADGYMGNLFFARNVSGVTAACLMIKRSIFEEVNGLDEELFKVAFNDVDLCMKIRRAGYLIVWTPYAEAYHYESISRGVEDTPEKQARFKKEVEAFQTKWKKELKEGDPYYNVNLTLDREDFSIK